MDIQELINLTTDEVLIVVELQKLVVEATEASRLIYKVYKCFGIGEDKIVVWNDGNNYEYLSYSGVWQVRYLHQTYDVICSNDGIFDLFKAEYFVENGYANEDAELRKKAEAAKYFRSFIKQTELRDEAKKEKN